MIVIFFFLFFKSTPLICSGLFISFGPDLLSTLISLLSLRVFRLISFPAKQDIQLRLHTLSPPRSLPSYPLHLQNPLPLPQLSALLTLLNQSLDIIDISTWTGDPQNGSFIAGQLRLLADTIDEARQVLKGGEEVDGGRWWEEPGDETVRFDFSPSTKMFTIFLSDSHTRPLFLYDCHLFIPFTINTKTQPLPPLSNSPPLLPPFSPYTSPSSTPPSSFIYAPSLLSTPILPPPPPLPRPPFLP